MSKQVKKTKKELTIEQKINRRNFISFASFAVLAGGAYGGWRWLYKSPDEAAGIIQTTANAKPERQVA